MRPVPAPTAPLLRPRRPHLNGAAAHVPAEAAVVPVARHRRPVFGPGLVPRERLVARLADARDMPLALLVAPAGYGKTTVLTEWAERDERPFAWVAVDPADDDPAHLVSSIALALDELEPVGRELLAALAARPAGRPGFLIERLARTLDARQRPFVLVLDDAHHVAAPATGAVLAAIVEHLPPGSQLALASRTEPELLPVGRLRAHRRLVELRAPDLAMTSAEAAPLLRGLGLWPTGVDLLVARTEGWPAGVYLAALALREQPNRGRAAVRFAGDDRLVADYLRDEVLAGLPPDQVRFLTRTSVLGELSGPLCDAALGTAGSGAMLRELARGNVMLLAVDRADGRYRHHRLLAEMLQAELRRLEPECEAPLHRRASAWHAGRGDVERAIHHALAAADVRPAGELLWRVAPAHVLQGRGALVRAWLERFTTEQTARHAPLALAAATSELATGDRGRIEHWCAAAERALRAAPGTAGAADDAVVSLLRAVIAGDGLARMRADAAAAGDRLAGDSAWQGMCRLLQGVADHLTGDIERARAHLEDGARRAAVAAPAVQVLCLAQLGVLAFDADDGGAAALCASRARRQAERHGLASYPTCALVFAVSALDRARRGRVDDARRDIREGTRLTDLLGDFAPWYEAEVRIVLARAALRLGDVKGARALLADAAPLTRRVPDAVVLVRWARSASARADAFSAAEMLDRSSLTTAELRVLRLLPTHLSFREIAGHLHVSANTIKTQAHAIYRKLHASSRTEAVANARQVGLLDA
jgi:LuxR family transcriptional regulator, maltose regulon positive regulatory protein